MKNLNFFKKELKKLTNLTLVNDLILVRIDLQTSCVKCIFKFLDYHLKINKLQYSLVKQILQI